MMGLIIINYIILRQQKQAMFRDRYVNADSDDGDEGFQRIPFETEQVVQAKSLDDSIAAYNSIALSAPRRTNKYFSNQRPNMKMVGLQELRRTKNASYNYIKSSSMQKGYRDEGEYEADDDQEDGNIRRRKVKQRLLRDKSISMMEELMETVMFKTKRTEIGEDLIIKNESQDQQTQIKQQILQQPNSQLMYLEKSSTSTHSFFKKLAQYKETMFLNSKYNCHLRQKLDRGKMKQEEEPRSSKGINFLGNFESGNLDHIIKVSQQEFNVYLRIDTNTRGHQSWFYFKVANNQVSQKRIKLNICNLKRKFRMIKLGQKIYVKKGVEGEWEKLQEDIEVVSTYKKKFKLSFQITLQASTQYYISLIPPYTYSDLLKDMEIYQKSPDVKVDILTHSLTGLAVPLLTITKGANMSKRSKDIQTNKKLFLISGRIHPSETCSSYIIKGFINYLISQKPEVQQFMKTFVIKIVPMLNPDGVVFGNFRTNYLGDDLNRSFHRSDDSIYPETVALKELGRICKQNYGDNFMGFLDMHGHSSQPNSFVYGPEYEQGSQNFIECRILPKILDQSSSYFQYNMCNFKLEEYKYNTARGYFFRKLKVPAYTIETSYALYHKKGGEEQEHKEMSIKEWKHYGEQFCKSLCIYGRYLDMVREKKAAQTLFKKIKDQKKTLDTRISTNKMNFTPFSTQNSDINVHSFQQLRKDIIKQIGQPRCKTKRDESEEQSDGESAEQDLPESEKEIIIKKVREVVYPSFLFPRVLKPAIVLPSVVPSIIILGKKQFKDISTMPKLANKFRNKRYNRPLNINHQYTEYLLKNIAGINSLRPEVINFNNFRKPKVVELKMEQDKDKEQN